MSTYEVLISDERVTVLDSYEGDYIVAAEDAESAAERAFEKYNQDEPRYDQKFYAAVRLEDSEDAWEFFEVYETLYSRIWAESIT